VEILELLFALVEGCGCFLELFALGANVGTAASGTRYVRARRKAKREGKPKPEARVAVWLFWLLLPLALLLTGIVIWKWLNGGHVR
jgi:hypothetical protein